MSTPREVAGRYRIDRRLGAGGMSTVFLAIDTVLERPVAVKLLAEHLADDADFVLRFRHEALSAARLQHPNVVQVFDSGQDAESHRHFIVMEYVEGHSCAELLREQRRLDLDRAVAVVRDACHGLEYAHRAGVVHRDVKPGNLLVAKETQVTKLADFGIAKAAEQTRITQVGSVLGTAAYLSPEQAHGEEAGPASDIYSLGVCAYQFLTGRLPHEYTSLTELALKQQRNPVDPITGQRDEVPEALDRAIRLALHADPRERYGTALEFAEAVTAGARGDLTAATVAFSGDEDATQALASGTLATQALPVEPRTAAPPSRRRAAVSPPPARPARREPERRRRGRRRLANLAIFLALLLAGAAVAFAIASSGGGGDAPQVIEDNVRDQIDGLRNLIEENSQ
jgi:serine/threonine-protein kinase